MVINKGKPRDHMCKECWMNQTFEPGDWLNRINFMHGFWHFIEAIFMQMPFQANSISRQKAFAGINFWYFWQKSVIVYSAKFPI